MIKVELSVLLTIYLLSGIVFIFSIWLFSEKRRKGKEIGKEDFIWKCSICNHTYLDSKAENVSRCPRCHTLMKR